MWLKFFAFLQPLDDLVYKALLPAQGESSHLPFWRAVTHLGDFSSLLILAWLVAMFVAILRRRALFSIWFFFGYGLGQVLSKGLKTLSARPRPFPYDGDFQVSASFPSGHTLGSLGLAIFLFVVWEETIASPLLKRFLQGVGLAMAVLIAVSRLMLGVHWFSDVYSGALIALVWSLFWIFIFRGKSLFSLYAPDLPHRNWKDETGKTSGGRA